MCSRLLAAVIFFCAIPTDAGAQTVIEASNVTLQALVSRSPTGFDSCGIRAVVITADSKFFEAYDFSIAVRPDMYYGMMKGGKRRLAITGSNPGANIPAAETPGPTKFWIAQELRGKPLSSFNVTKSNDVGFSLMLGDLVESYRIIYQIMAGERMQFALRYAAEKLDTVVSFSGKLAPEQISSVQACMNEVTSQLNAKASDK